MPSLVVAADINLTIHQESIDNNVKITIDNNSPQKILHSSIELTLNKQKYEHSSQGVIPPHQSKIFYFKVQYPENPGSYPLIVNVRYFNDGVVLSSHIQCGSATAAEATSSGVL